MENNKKPKDFSLGKVLVIVEDKIQLCNLVAPTLEINIPVRTEVNGSKFKEITFFG